MNIHFYNNIFLILKCTTNKKKFNTQIGLSFHGKKLIQNVLEFQS